MLFFSLPALPFAALHVLCVIRTKIISISDPDEFISLSSSPFSAASRRPIFPFSVFAVAQRKAQKARKTFNVVLW